VGLDVHGWVVDVGGGVRPGRRLGRGENRGRAAGSPASRSLRTSTGPVQSGLSVHAELDARRWSYPQRQPGRPTTSPTVRALAAVRALQHAPAAPVAPILVRDDKPRTRDRDDRGYRLPLVTTDLESAAEDLVARYASRWGIEQAFADARHIVGVGEARHRTRRAVERTVPFGLICFSVVTVWYALHGHAPDDVTSHRTRAAGTPRRPNRPTTTWPSSSAGSSSPRDFAVHAPSRPARKKPGPSSQPGPQPGHDQPKLRNTRARCPVCGSLSTSGKDSVLTRPRDLPCGGEFALVQWRSGGGCAAPLAVRGRRSPSRSLRCRPGCAPPRGCGPR
jgi:hypothetical protein